MRVTKGVPRKTILRKLNSSQPRISLKRKLRVLKQMRRLNLSFKIKKCLRRGGHYLEICSQKLSRGKAIHLQLMCNSSTEGTAMIK